MSSFTRYAAVAAVVLSLGFFVAALPTLRADMSIPPITGKDAVSVLCAKAFVDIEAAFKALLQCATLAEVKAHIEICVDLLQTCAANLLKLGAEVEVTADAQASIVACIAALITLIVRVFAELTIKFGLDVIAALCVPLDAAIHVCLVNLNICVDGVIVLIVKAIASVDVTLLVKLHLKLCLSVLGFTL